MSLAQPRLAADCGGSAPHNLLQSEPIIWLPIPMSVFLDALDRFSREELQLIQRRLQKCLAA